MNKAIKYYIVGLLILLCALGLDIVVLNTAYWLSPTCGVPALVAILSLVLVPILLIKIIVEGSVND